MQISSTKDGKETLWLHQSLYRAIKSSIPPEENIVAISAALSPWQRLTVNYAGLDFTSFCGAFERFLKICNFGSALIRQKP